MPRDRLDSEELSHDLFGYRSNVITEREIDSIFLDEVEDLEPEPKKRQGVWHRIGGKDVFVECKTKAVGDKNGFQVIVEDK